MLKKLPMEGNGFLNEDNKSILHRLGAQENSLQKQSQAIKSVLMEMDDDVKYIHKEDKVECFDSTSHTLSFLEMRRNALKAENKKKSLTTNSSKYYPSERLSFSTSFKSNPSDQINQNTVVESISDAQLTLFSIREKRSEAMKIRAVKHAEALESMENMRQMALTEARKQKGMDTAEAHLRGKLQLKGFLSLLQFAKNRAKYNYATIRGRLKTLKRNLRFLSAKLLSRGEEDMKARFYEIKLAWARIARKTKESIKRSQSDWEHVSRAISFNRVYHLKRALNTLKRTENRIRSYSIRASEHHNNSRLLSVLFILKEEAAERRARNRSNSKTIEFVSRKLFRQSKALLQRRLKLSSNDSNSNISKSSGKMLPTLFEIYGVKALKAFQTVVSRRQANHRNQILCINFFFQNVLQRVWQKFKSRLKESIHFRRKRRHHYSHMFIMNPRSIISRAFNYWNKKRMHRSEQRALISRRVKVFISGSSLDYSLPNDVESLSKLVLFSKVWKRFRYKIQNIPKPRVVWKVTKRYEAILRTSLHIFFGNIKGFILQRRKIERKMLSKLMSDRKEKLFLCLNKLKENLQKNHCLTIAEVCFFRRAARCFLNRLDIFSQVQQQQRNAARRSSRRNKLLSQGFVALRNKALIGRYRRSRIRLARFNIYGKLMRSYLLDWYKLYKSHKQQEYNYVHGKSHFRKRYLTRAMDRWIQSNKLFRKERLSSGHSALGRASRKKALSDISNKREIYPLPFVRHYFSRWLITASNSIQINFVKRQEAKCFHINRLLYSALLYLREHSYKRRDMDNLILNFRIEVQAPLYARKLFSRFKRDSIRRAHNKETYAIGEKAAVAKDAVIVMREWLNRAKYAMQLYDRYAFGKSHSNSTSKRKALDRLFSLKTSISASRYKMKIAKRFYHFHCLEPFVRSWRRSILQSKGHRLSLKVAKRFAKYLAWNRFSRSVKRLFKRNKVEPSSSSLPAYRHSSLASLAISRGCLKPLIRSFRMLQSQRVNSQRMKMLKQKARTMKSLNLLNWVFQKGFKVIYDEFLANNFRILQRAKGSHNQRCERKGLAQWRSYTRKRKLFKSCQWKTNRLLYQNSLVQWREGFLVGIKRRMSLSGAISKASHRKMAQRRVLQNWRCNTRQKRLVLYNCSQSSLIAFAGREEKDLPGATRRRLTASAASFAVSARSLASSSALQEQRNLSSWLSLNNIGTVKRCLSKLSNMKRETLAWRVWRGDFIVRRDDATKANKMAEKTHSLKMLALGMSQLHKLIDTSLAARKIEQLGNRFHCWRGAVRALASLRSNHSVRVEQYQQRREYITRLKAFYLMKLRINTGDKSFLSSEKGQRAWQGVNAAELAFLVPRRRLRNALLIVNHEAKGSRGQQEREKLAFADHCQHTRMLRNAVSKWNKRVRFHHQSSLRVNRFCLLRRLNSAFAVLRVRRRFLINAAAHYKRDSLRRVLRAWVRRRRVQRCYQTISANTVARKAFKGWRLALLQAMKVRLFGQWYEARVQLRSLSDAFLDWRLRTKFEVDCDRFLARKLKAELRSCLLRWKSITRSGKHSSSSKELTRLSKSFPKKPRVFSDLVDYGERKQRQKVDVLRATRFHSHRNIRVAFCYLRELRQFRLALIQHRSLASKYSNKPTDEFGEEVDNGPKILRVFDEFFAAKKQLQCLSKLRTSALQSSAKRDILFSWFEFFVERVLHRGFHKFCQRSRTRRRVKKNVFLFSRYEMILRLKRALRRLDVHHMSKWVSNHRQRLMDLHKNRQRLLQGLRSLHSFKNHRKASRMKQQEIKTKNSGVI